MTEQDRGERPAEEEVLPPRIRSLLVRNIQAVGAEEESEGGSPPLLETDTKLGSLVRHLIDRHVVAGQQEGPMSRAMKAHVRRMVGIYLVDFGIEDTVQRGEMEMRTLLPPDVLEGIDNARVRASELADEGWVTTDQCWVTARWDIYDLFEPNADELK